MPDDFLAGAEPTETPAEPIATQDAGTEKQAAPVDLPQEQQEQQAEDVQGDLRTLPKYIKDLQAVDAKAYRDAKNDFFSSRSYREKLKDFDLDKVRGFLDENGGLDGLTASRQELAAKVQEYEGLTEAVGKGDASVLDRMAEVNPEGAANIIAAGIDRLATMNPDVYNAKLGSIFSATIQQQGIPQKFEKMSWNLEAMGDVIRASPELLNNPSIVRAFNALHGDLTETQQWAGSFGKQQPSQQSTQKPADPGEAAWQREKQEFEANKFNTEYRSEVSTWRNGAIDKELGEFYALKKDDATLQDIARTTVETKVKERMKSDADFMKSLMAFETKRDKAGALRLIQSREKAAIAEIAPQVGRSIFGQPKPAEPTPAARPAQRQAAAPPPPPQNSKDAVFAEIFAR